MSSSLGIQTKPLLLQESANAKPAEPRNQKVEQAAQMYEAHFLREMVRAMRKTVPESELVDVSMGEKIYREQLDDNYVDTWVQKGGIGLSDVIYDQIMFQLSKMSPSRRGAQLAPGTLPIGEKGQNLAVKMTGSTPSSQTYKLDLKSKELSDVKSPWGGSVEHLNSEPDGSVSVTLNHENQLKSVLHFKGVASSLTPGQKIHGGQKLGVLSPDSNQIYWSVRASEKDLDSKLGAG